MPPKRTSAKKATPSGQEQDPASVQHEVQGDQDREEPPLNVDDISFEVEEHDDTANLKREETKGDEERESSTEDVGDEALFMACIDDLGINSQGLNMMTKGQLSDLKELCKMKGHDPKECLMLVSQIMLPIPNLTASSARSSRDLQRRVDKAKADSKSFDQDTIEVDGFALLSQETDAYPKREISMQDAGKFLMAHQLEVDGPLFVEERNGKYNLITNDNDDPISLSPDAWRALSNYGKACLYAMRKNHTKRNGLNGGGGGGGGGKTNDKGYKTNARQRTKITAEPEESAPKRQLPPSSLPGLKTMDQSELAEMLKTLKAQSDSMARAQALQAQENARIMSSIGFLTDSLAADEDLGSTD